MARVLGRVLGCLCAALLLTSPAFGLEIEDDLGEVGAPSLGIYQVVYLTTYVNRDADLTRGYRAIVDLDFPRAIPALQKCLRRTRRSQPRLASEAATFLGYCHLNLLQPSAAIDAENTAVRLDPRNAVAHFFLAQEYFIQNNRPLVRQNLEAAIKLRPGFLPALRMLAEAAKEEGRGKDAIKLYTEIVHYLPNSGYYRYQQYRACIDAADYQQAEKALRALMQIEPAFVINHYRLGDVYLAQQRFPEALAEYTMLDSSPDFKYLAHLGFAKVEQKQHALEAALHDARLADTLSNGANEEAHSMLKRVEVDLQAQAEEARQQAEEARQRTLNNVRTWVFRCGGLAVFFALLLVARVLRRRDHLLAEMASLNEELGRSRDQDELSAFLLDYFCPLLGCQTGVVLLHNRFSNQLTTHTSRHLEDDELSRLKVVTASELGTWLEGLRKALLKTAELGPEFEKLFPSLQQRLVKASIEYLLVLRERDYFLGFIGVGGTGKSNGRLQAYDMLGPLLRTAAKSMEAVILYETSMNDETTGLYNKRYFKQALGTELRRADRYQQPCSLLTFDIDDFKKINDTYGHGQGDLV
ncbi:MAG TPA: diguanylate cyclase, partial [Candidatus Xenobia bacterium]